MGAWISIHIALLFNNNSNENIHVNNLKHGKNQTVYIDGIIGIAAAPDFIQDLWLQNQDQNQNRNKADSKSNNDAVHIKSRYERSSYRIYITSKLVEDAKKNWEILPSTVLQSERKKPS